MSNQTKHSGSAADSLVVGEAQANLQLDFLQLAHVVGPLRLIHALQQVWLQVCDKDCHCTARGVLQRGCSQQR